MSQNTETATPFLYPIPVVMAVLGLGKTKTFELLSSGEIESVVVGRRRLVPRQSLEAFVSRLRAEQNGSDA